jgi:hypothetical protein
LLSQYFFVTLLLEYIIIINEREGIL